MVLLKNENAAIKRIISNAESLLKKNKKFGCFS